MFLVVCSKQERPQFFIWPAKKGSPVRVQVVPEMSEAIERVIRKPRERVAAGGAVHGADVLLMRELRTAEVIRHEPERPANMKLQPTIAADIFAPCEMAATALGRVTTCELKAVGHEDRIENLASRAEYVGSSVHETSACLAFPP